MKKKEYIDAINEIQVDSNLKTKTLNKITAKKKYRKASIFATILITFVIAISIIIPMNSNKNKITPIEIVEENNGLPKLENFENLYNILKSQDSVFNETWLDSITINSASASVSEKTENTTDYSTTNLQVEGVDEADVVKTDGDYIYYISSKKIVIVNVKDKSNLKIESEQKYEDFYPNELYINGNKLVVIGENNNNYKNLNMVETMYSIGNTATIAKVYNIENKSKPKLEREVEVEGDYLSSRMIDDNLYFITNEYLYSYLIRNKELDEINQDEFKPAYRDTAISNEKNI